MVQGKSAFSRVRPSAEVLSASGVRQKGPASAEETHPRRLSGTRKNGGHLRRRINIFNLRQHSAGCFRETTKHLEKTTKDLEKITKHLEKTKSDLVNPENGPFSTENRVKTMEKARVGAAFSISAMQIYNIFRRKANRPFRVLTFRRRRRGARHYPAFFEILTGYNGL